MAYKSKYKPQNPAKCINCRLDVPIQCRSLWERKLAEWCDRNPNITEWGSETVVVPYICRTDLKQHRYFVDFQITFTNGQTFLIEVKPEKETSEPRRNKSGRVTWRYKKDLMTYIKNYSKWEFARSFAKTKGWIFETWTEKHLQKLGLKILT